MRFTRILGVVIVLLGIGALIFANYLNHRLSDAGEQIADAKQKVKEGNALFSLNPVAKEIGGELTNSAEKKISKAEHTVQYYENIASFSQTGGICLLVVGVGIFLLSFKKS
jgi:hypothetical protein